MTEQTKNSSKSVSITISNLAIPILLYVLGLAVPIPAPFSKLFSFYSIPLFALVLALYYAAFRFTGRWRWMAGAGLTLLLLALKLSFLWDSGYSIDKIMGGLLPFRDANDYYQSARFLSTGRLIPNTTLSAWRPLFAGYLASVLWLTGGNYQAALAVMVGLAGLAFYLSADYVRKMLGDLPAALYITLTGFYIQPLIGSAYTEQLGLALGCLGFVLLWIASRTGKIRDLVAGLLVLVLAVSARAGAFFIFPVLILWAGWAFRGGRRFSFIYAGISTVAILVTYLAVNTVFNRLTVQPGAPPFGNFAFTLYGQVVGGAGYNWAIRTLGSRNPAVVYHLAIQFFLDHPFSFAIGAAKAYRDFFLPQLGIFGFQTTDQPAWQDDLFWILLTGCFLWGLVKSVRRMGLPSASLLAAGLIGIFISIPFLPPIDGGIRIYASTMPFIYIFPALAVEGMMPQNAISEDGSALRNPAAGLSLGLGLLAAVVPVLILHLVRETAPAAPHCPADQTPFAVVVNPGSYIDLVPGEGSFCTRVPEVCLGDFKANMSANDPSDQQVVQQFLALSASGATRILPANDLLQNKYFFFVGPSADFHAASAAYRISGCAVPITIPKRTPLYQIRSVEADSTDPAVKPWTAADGN